MNSTTELPVETANTRRTDHVDENFFVSRQGHVVKKAKLNRGEQAALRSLIQGPVAAMTAEQLSGLLDTGLESDVRYRNVIAGMRERVLAPEARLQDLLTYLQQEVRTKSGAEQGISVPAPTAVMVLVLEAVARQLGKDWMCDAASFIDVTIASARLQSLAQSLSEEAERDAVNPRAPFAAIILPRDEQHSLMSYLTGALYQTLGWQQQVILQESISRPEIARKIAQANVVCIGWSNMRLKPNVARLVADIRLISANETPPLIAGGVAALDFVEFLVEMGVDCICDSAISAVKVSESFYNLEKIKGFAALKDGNAERQTSRFDRQFQ
ncbi:cobalamin-binding protein [Roseibium sp. FZY0029]|uniref:cobalamin-binding protein n=1 Tax=Roseibium sp. FZY0029 TaxID=3116647 RepID=UPI002EA3D0CA|nr:cobalamin-binding protein [Roseibium sp. FZY0029]